MVRLTFLWSDLKTSHTAIFGILDYVSNELFFDNKKVFINDILLIVKFILFYHNFYLWWKIVCLFFLQNLSNKKQDMLKLRNRRECVSLIKNKLYILYMSLLQRNMFFLFFVLFLFSNWNSLNERLNSYYKAWSYKKKKCKKIKGYRKSL